MNIKKFLVGIVTVLLMSGVLTVPAFADSVSVNFENPPYTVGNINGQDGWIKTGPYDVAVVSNIYGYATFGSQSLRMSDSVTSGSFGDQTFAKPLVDAVGESSATAGGFSVGTRQTHFEMQFDIASTLATLQTGMHVSVSPDRGDGSRMSYLRFEDQSDGIHVFFDDVTDAGPIGIVATFNESDIATLTRTPHTIKLTMDTLDGPANDVVKVYIDGALKKTGTSWEDYYRYDPEAIAEQSPRIVKTVLFRESGTVTPADAGKGFLVDNLTTESVTPVMPSVPSITAPANNSVVTSAALTEIDWTVSTGTFTPMTYQYQAFSDANYTSLVYSSGWLTNNKIPTPGTPDGVYYVQVRAQDAEGNISAWSNDANNPYEITVSEATPTPTPSPTPTPVGPPTNKNQCKDNGWRIFNNPSFKNQGDCVSYVEHHQKGDDDRDDDHDKEHGEKSASKAIGNIRMGNPRQRMFFEAFDYGSSNKDKGKVNYWNYDYPGVLHYTASVLCAQVSGKNARFMFQIPAGWPGLTGLYVVSAVHDGGTPGTNGDTYGHNSTSNLATALTWCESGVGFTPNPYPITGGNLVVHD